MIDRRLVNPWPADVVAASRRFRQGHVVGDPPFLYARSDAHVLWEVDFEAGELEAPADESVIDLGSGDRPPFGLITTQTCDLFEEGPRQRQPWFSVVPVYDITEILKDGQLAQIDRGEVGHLIRLTSDRFSASAWVADLRIEIPVEKGWLVGREPIEAFMQPDEYEVLAARLMKRKGRPAISTAVTNTLRKPLLDWLRGPGKAYRAEIHAVRLEAVGHLPTTRCAGLLVIAEDEGLSEQAKSAWAAWEAAAVDAAASAGVTIMPTRHGSQDTMSARDILNSVPIDLDFLS